MNLINQFTEMVYEEDRTLIYRYLHLHSDHIYDPNSIPDGDIEPALKIGIVKLPPLQYGSYISAPLAVQQ